MGNSENKSFATIRSIVTGLLLIIINSHYQTGVSSTLDIEITDLSLFSNVVFFMFILVLLNHILWKLKSIRSLSQNELLTIYIMLATSTALNGTDMIKCLVSLVSNGTWYATPENEWDNLFGPYLPEWLTISNRKILKGYYEGQSSLYVSEYLKAWLPRAIVWSGFATVLIFTMVCINIILRQQWVRNERLSYPIIQLPYEMTRTGKSWGLFKNKLLWIGFSSAGFVSIVNQLHVWNPIIPSIPIQPVSLTHYFETKPWNAVRDLNRTFYPFAIGIAYLMPLDLIVSTWFFHIFWQIERVAGSAAGLSSLPGFPYAEAQVTGSWIALLIFALWIGRRYFISVIKRIFRTSKYDTEGLMSYRNASIGILAGISFLVIFCYYAGMTVWIMVIFFIIYFALSTTITRIRAELGPPIHTMHGSTPDEILLMTLGSRRIGPKTITGFGLLHWITGYSNRENPMPIQLEAFKLAERTNAKPSRLTTAIVLSALVGSISGFWAYLHDGYKLGVESYPERTWAASVGFDVLESRIQNPIGFQSNFVIFSIIGFVFTIFMLLMRMRFLWWSLHPVGYAVSGEWGIGRIFLPLIIASIAKYSVLRFSGLRAYRQSMPFFFGLILGDFVMGCIWATIGIMLDTRVYVYWTG
ncbi:MAG: DUF6785 family protein [bacterium]